MTDDPCVPSLAALAPGLGILAGHPWTGAKDGKPVSPARGVPSWAQEVAA